MIHETILSVSAIIVAVCAIAMTRQLWLLSNRPVVSAVVETVEGGNKGTALKLVVSNVGNRAAEDVQLRVERTELDRLLIKSSDDPTTAAVRNCFSTSSAIPLLTPGSSTECSFGFLAGESSDSTWREETTLPVKLSYRDMTTGRTFRHTVTIRIADNSSFTGSVWASRA